MQACAQFRARAWPAPHRTRFCRTSNQARADPNVWRAQPAADIYGCNTANLQRAASPTGPAEPTTRREHAEMRATRTLLPEQQLGSRSRAGRSLDPGDRDPAPVRLEP